MDPTVRVFGYQPCDHCQQAVLDIVAWKTGGRCADCYRAKLGPMFDGIVAVTKQRERIRVTLDRRSPGERAQRRRAKNRVKDRDSERAKTRVRMLAVTRARARLARIFPEIFEVILADERARLGLEAWSIERAVTPHRVDHKTMELLQSYHALEEVPEC